ncbi:SRPBCC domain-containing protein [Cellulosimicrobium arenosum]|uniref:SRPBCC domain-containing protein n=1 Tax=Cellulosimicrobium arenosum TaxID=2708133 RepID=A0A927G8R8_9MICO|nr:SRPBCC domain-containing protein [Cellulosimicrobium arenosum]MBD8078405.1 SRPBCC domain-containing protein [Cellulosimicrobium arenosum]
MTDTDQSGAVIDAEQFQVTRTLRIEAPPARVWAALTQEDLISQWFGQRTTLPDLRVGGEGVFGFDGYGDVGVRIEEYDEPAVLAFRWGASVGEELRVDNSTVARFTLVPDGAATVLSVVETGFEHLADPRAAMDDNRQGWTAELDELVAFLDSATVA